MKKAYRVKRRLTHKEENRISHAINDRVMHFSPTISPAPKDMENGEIESLLKAIEYYKEMGETTLIMQPKYMGSYCDIYLAKDIEKTRFFSRRGYPVPDRVNREALIDAVRPLWNRFFSETDTLELVVIQAELMPWAALGKGLIDRDFRGYEECHQTHADYIKDSGINEILKDAQSDVEYHEFLVDAGTLSKKDLKAKYPDHVQKHYYALASISVPKHEEYQNAIDVYRKQVDIYGADGDIHFKPFNWLKMVFQDGEENINKSNSSGFMMVSGDNYVTIHLNSTTETKDIQSALAMYKFWTEVQGMEGAVIKPNTIWKTDMVPMFKVRNNNYLQMIYGVKFQSDFEHYISRRRVGRKIKCSINEWNIAQSLLRVPMKDISPENEEYVKELKNKL